MKRIFNIPWHVLTELLIIFTLVHTVIADDKPYAIAGVLDDLQAGGIVVNDTVFSVSAETSVRSKSGLTLTLSDLKVGNKVGCNFIRTGEHAWHITEIWRLGDSFNLEEYTANNRALLTAPY